MAKNRQRGSITVFFVLFLLVILGVFSYSYFVGKSVDQKIRVANAADTAAYSMASHAAAGLNMIAVNNLAIATSMHVAASSQELSRYYAIGQAIATDVYDVDKAAKMYYEPDDSDYAKTYPTTAKFSGHFMQTAHGLTEINKSIAKYWLLGAFAKGLEQFRSNAPGAIGFPLQVSKANLSDGPNIFRFRYEKLKLTSGPDTMCHAIHASDGLDGRDLATKWAGSPFRSVGVNPLSVLEPVESVARGAMEAANLAFLAGQGVAGARFAAECINISGFFNPNCYKYLTLMYLLSLRIPIPEVEACGLNDEGDYAVQMTNFMEKEAKAKDTEIGFVYPAITTAEDEEEFHKSLQFSAVVGQPQFTSLELNEHPVADGNLCPEEWRFAIHGKDFCGIVSDGFDQEFSRLSNGASGTKLDHETSLISGGVAQTVRAGEGTFVLPGRLRSIWRRIQWAIGQARAVYKPENDDPKPAPRMRLFWPAWKAEMAPVTVREAVFNFFRST
jgi:hypothetical protein